MDPLGRHDRRHGKYRHLRGRVQRSRGDHFSGRPAAFGVEQCSPEAVADAPRQRRQAIELCIAGEEEAGALLAAVRIRPAVVALDAEHDLAQLDVVAGLPAHEGAAEIGVDPCTTGNEAPILFAPDPAEETAGVWASPVVGDRSRGAPVFDAAAPVRSELVAQAGIDAPAFDVLADPVVGTGVAEPTGIDDRRGRAQGELAIGSDAAGRQRARGKAEHVEGWIAGQRGGHVVGEFMEHAGREVRLPGDAARREVGADAHARPAQEAFHVIDLHGAGGHEPEPGEERSRHVESIDLHAGPDDPCGRLDDQPLPRDWL